MGRQERRALIEQIQAERNSVVVCYLTSDRENANALISKDVLPLFYELLRRAPKAERVDVVMFTQGGDTLAGFGLSRLLREFADHVGALVPDKCHSAGTLFSLGASEIVMTRLATLSPIDPSVTGPLNPAVELGPGQRHLVPLSVESVAGFKALATEDWGLEDGDGLNSAFRCLSDRVHPLALGNVFRSRQQIESLARKLLLLHRKDGKQVTTIIDQLTKQLGSHDYLISRTEARGLLGKQVLADNEQLEDRLWALHQDFVGEMQLGLAYEKAASVSAAKAAGQPLPVRVVLRLAVIESTAGRYICDREVMLGERTIQTPYGPQRAIEEEPLGAGWKFEP
jgi:hypothetical protein